MKIEVNLDLNDLADALAKNQNKFAEAIELAIEDYGVHLLPSLIKKIIFRLTNTENNSKQNAKSKAFELASLIQIELAKAYPKPKDYEPNSYTPIEVIESLDK